MKNLIRVLASYLLSPNENVIVTHGVYYHKTTYTFNDSGVTRKTDQDKIDSVYNGLDFDKIFK
ncbi:hypothetical protein H4V97_000278 [Flavobacterium sp. CG_23.5]|uniref:hypothetical protein n=1 Tax=Flavobacterium sp. CG_23.5 TaxID=2760708 RepID=UPI001AE8E0D8|nr:hypothetical protein [Flavobacterium sp. CG_23.5]MBP2281960.1 hypothetical protein [Flavobacterium sp. CG_23.5]